MVSCKYFDGKELYGNDFNPEQIRRWYSDESEGYSSLIDKNYEYGFHELNKFHGYRFLPKDKKLSVLSFGGAFGDELLPIIRQIDEITIVEPSKKLRQERLVGIKIKYVTPSIDGKLPFKDDSFDLITCFGVLHHIPNVSFVIRELSRVLRPKGVLLLREPIISMGDWKNERAGLTKRERGIPLNILEDNLQNRLRIVSERKVIFPVTKRIPAAYNNKWVVWLDYLLSRMFSWNRKYHARNIFDKIKAQSVFIVAIKNKPLVVMFNTSNHCLFGSGGGKK